PKEIKYPHEGCEEGTPKPKKLKEASEIITKPSCTVTITIIEDTHIGKIYLNIILKLEAPKAFAESTKLFFFVDNVALLVTLANVTHLVIERVIIIFVTLGPNTPAIKIASKIAGKAS